ncbi:glycosyltransferase family 4 protein [Simiduia sp. 21SJ11W-1]|uniref:glycosyltransferase family 4 protein n=1 Tax=Simiduia sp. 21SJ11W-1 TaxID=2909669 RepID=UPI00209F3C20|nr:glycosyltransferase family 4 protein [Simiduia sp. 21SJ11W-1]UTA48000.1 glycosyltransferase family 4 protein [Simiduia sp. 21SJ11W-1]
MKVLQVLPNLNSGGVERGTVEFARELVAQGHESIVLSNGGRLVVQLEAEGSRHISLPVHKKSLWQLRWVRRLRRLLEELQPDIIHVRSRAPMWLIWLAWRKLPAANRPRLVSTFHGLYSVNAYSAVMAKAEQVIAISDCVADYVQRNYGVPRARLTVIPRGVDLAAFSPRPPAQEWCAALYRDYPHLKGKTIILMPGRLSRWKGQEAYLQMMQQLQARAPECHGVIVGDAEPKKAHYRKELEQQARALGLADHVTFVGHRADIAEFYRLAQVVCHMSNKPEPFGRTLTEALAAGTPVVAFDRGGASESLSACFPQGLVAPDDITAFTEKVAAMLGPKPEITVLPAFTMTHQINATLSVYRQLLNPSETAQ